MNNVDYKRAILTDGFIVNQSQKFWPMDISNSSRNDRPYICKCLSSKVHKFYLKIFISRFFWVGLTRISFQLFFCLNLLQWDGNSSRECYTIKPDVLKGGFWVTMKFGTELIWVKGLSHESLVSDIRIQKDHGVSFRPPSDDFKLFN